MAWLDFQVTFIQSMINWTHTATRKDAVNFITTVHILKILSYISMLVTMQLLSFINAWQLGLKDLPEPLMKSSVHFV